jgi:hypothetical protein
MQGCSSKKHCCNLNSPPPYISYIFQIVGKSYRLRNNACKIKGEAVKEKMNYPAAELRGILLIKYTEKSEAVRYKRLPLDSPGFLSNNGLVGCHYPLMDLGVSI